MIVHFVWTIYTFFLYKPRVKHKNKKYNMRQVTRLGRKPIANEDTAYTILQLCLQNNMSGLGKDFLARSRAISKDVSRFTNGINVKPPYSKAIEVQ